MYFRTAIEVTCFKITVIKYLYSESVGNGLYLVIKGFIIFFHYCVVWIFKTEKITQFYVTFRCTAFSNNNFTRHVKMEHEFSEFIIH